MKKTLAILLSLALVICMIPATALAAVSVPDTIVNQVTITKDAAEIVCNVSLSGTNVKYNGTNQEPRVTVTPITTGVTIGASDYSVNYYNMSNAPASPSPKDAGTYKVVVTSTNGEAQFYVGNFTIQPLTETDLTYKTTSNLTFSTIKDLTDKSAELNGLFGVYFGNYQITDGVAIEATKDSSNNEVVVIFKLSDSNLPSMQITKRFPFTVSLIDNYTVTIGKTVVYTGEEVTPTVSFSKKNSSDQIKETLISGEDFIVTGRDNINVGSANSATVIIEGVGAKGFSGTIQDTFTITSKAFGDGTGFEITNKVTSPGAYPEVQIRYNDKLLQMGKDYYYSAKTADNATVGDTVSATINGKGNFSGSMQITGIKVCDANKNIANATVTLKGATSYDYSRSAQYPTVSSVKFGSSTALTKDTDYTVSYQKADGTPILATNIKDAGDYKIIVTGEDTYTGTWTKDFTIKPLSVTSSLITATYTGKANDPVTMKHSSSLMALGTDYTVDSYTANKASYVVTGKGNYTGTRTVYAVTRTLSNCTINFSDNRSSVAYGPTYYPKVTVYDYTNGKTTKLYENTDYTLTYKNSKNQVVDYCKDPGTYSVIVTGKGAYTGTKTLTFTIGGTDISNYTVTLKESSVNVTGHAQTPVITSVKYGYTNSLTSNDYTVTYQDENGKTVTTMSAPGTYKVVVKGKNGYSGSTYTTFRIVGKQQTVTVDKDSYKKYPTSDYFKITASATGDGTGFTYTSNNPSVASVSSTGYVTIHKVGRAVITVKATGMKMYEPASKTVEVKVYPNKAKLSRKPWTDGKKGQMKVRWGYQDGVTKYQIRYSRDKNFSSGSYLTKTVKAHGKDYTTQSTTISNLKRGYTYYFKVRAVYTDPVTGDNYYGSWSSWRSAKTI